MITSLYNRTIHLAETRYALFMLAVISFAESSVFPIPPDVLMIPMIIAAPNRAWMIAGVCTVASVAGGAGGYWIGAQLLDLVGRPVLEFYGKWEKFPVFAEWYSGWGIWAVLVAGVTPFPYKVITIASGAAHFDFIAFMLSSVVARGLRFFIIAAAHRAHVLRGRPRGRLHGGPLARGSKVSPAPPLRSPLETSPHDQNPRLSSPTHGL